ncbi:MAG TPA: hypothetical protein VOA87_08890 [Thermoanaerobaculia bacterium]|nr:hypothetical protein [Thermoanaerobaculia bacterium]
MKNSSRWLPGPMLPPMSKAADETAGLSAHAAAFPGDRPGLPRWSPARWAVLRHLVDAVAPEARAGLQADVDLLARQLAHLATPPAQVAESEILP